MRRGRTLRAGSLAALAAALLLLAPGCAARKERKRLESQFLPAERLVELARQEIAARNLRRARTYLERVNYSPAERPTLEPIVRLLLADVAFWQGDDLSLIEARSKYQDFVTLYGDHPRAPYALFQAGMCSFKQARSPARDQAQTRTAMSDLRDVIRRYPDSPYARAARTALDDAEAYLAEHEYGVGVFYLKRKRYPAAIERLRNLLEAYPRFGEKDKVYFQLGRALLASGSPAEGRAFLDRVIRDYGSGEYAEDAREILARSEAADKAPASGEGSGPSPGASR